MHTHPKSAVNGGTTWTRDKVGIIPQRGRHDCKYSKIREHCVLRNAMKASVTELEKMGLVRGRGSRSSNQSMAGPGPSSQMKAIQELEHMDSTISFRPWKVSSGIVEEAGEVESQLAQEEVGGNAPAVTTRRCRKFTQPGSRGAGHRVLLCVHLERRASEAVSWRRENILWQVM